jgi:tetratricopeptide (TPR) repeat protein/peroxiredoxin
MKSCMSLLFILAFSFGAQGEEPLDAENIKICTKNLVEIGKALQAYQEKHGDIPEWLSDLYPEYLKDKKLFLCPADSALGDPAYPQAKDPKLPVSYVYEFNPSMREHKIEQRRAFGDIIPIVRCRHHRKGEEPVFLNLSYAFEVYQSGINWEREPRALENLLANIKKNIIEDSPESAANISLEAISYLNREQMKEIGTFAEEIVKFQSDNGPAYKVYSLMQLMERRNPEETLAAFGKAMALLPKDAEVHYVAGMLYSQFRRPQEAIEALEVMLQLQPDNPKFFQSYPVISQLYVQAGREKDVDKLIDRFKLAMNSDSPQDQVYLGDMLIARKRYQEALQIFEKLSEEDPSETYFMGRLAEIHQAMGNSELAREYQRKTDPSAAMVGEVVPDFSATDLDGKPISLKDYRGKVVLLDFWAVWCRPCTSEMPNVKRIYEKFNDSGFEIIGISLDTDESRLRAYIKDNGITWRQVFSGRGWSSPVSRQYGIRSIPAPWLIDKDGKLISPRARGSALERMVADALKK